MLSEVHFPESTFAEYFAYSIIINLCFGFFPFVKCLLNGFDDVPVVHLDR